MPNPIIYTVTMPSGNTYDLVDKGARDLIQELMNFHEWLGITTSDITDGSTINPVIIDGEEVTAEAGDVVSRADDHKDYVLSSTGVWQNFGNLSGLGALAFKNSASGSYTPAGTVSQPTFTGSPTQSSGSYTPAGTISQPTFTGEALTLSGSYTPAGTVSQPTFSNGTCTPNGSVSNIELNTKTIKQFKTAGTLANCTMPTFTVSNGNLTITDGEYTAGTLPTGEDVAVGAGTVKTQPVFSGAATSVTGTVSQPTFSGTAATVEVSGTPTGTVSQPTFSGTAATIEVEGTAEGTVSQPTFSGTAATITVE